MILFPENCLFFLSFLLLPSTWGTSVWFLLMFPPWTRITPGISCLLPVPLTGSVTLLVSRNKVSGCFILPFFFFFLVCVFLVLFCFLFMMKEHRGGCEGQRICLQTSALYQIVLPYEIKVKRYKSRRKRDNVASLQSQNKQWPLSQELTGVVLPLNEAGDKTADLVP